MSIKTKSTIVILGLLFLYTMALIVGIPLVFPSHDNASQAAENDVVSNLSRANSQAAPSNEVKQVSSVTARPEEPAPIKPIGVDERLEQQQKRLQMIEEKATQKRQQIEKDYLKRYTELQERVNATVATLDSKEKSAWADLTQKLKHTVSTISTSTKTRDYVRPHGYNRYFIESNSDSKEQVETRVVGNPAQEYADKKQRITEEKSNTLASYKRDFQNLQELRQYQLGEVEKWEELSKSYVFAAINSITKIPKTDIPGLIEGILYSENKSSIILRNNRKIMHEGDTIHGITIVKIYKDKVAFAKNGQSWTQKIRETPGPEWKQ